LAIKVTCAGCSSSFNAPDNSAGKSGKCPKCGGPITVPRAEPFAAPLPSRSQAAEVAQSRPVAVAPPPPAVVNDTRDCPFCGEAIKRVATKCRFCGELLGEERRSAERAAGPVEEETLLTARPAPFRNQPIRTAMVLLVFVIALLVAASTPSPEAKLAAGGIAGFAGFIFVYWYLQAMTTSLTVTNKRSTLRRGILAKRTREVRHADIRVLDVNQSFTDRLLGVGSIAIGSAGLNDVEISIGGVRNPRSVREAIDKQRP
jgi:hypothetical protein